MTGKITLIGAGPGDVELLTVKALRKIREADVVVYDRLINPELLHECHENCEKIDVGKQPNYHPVPQAKIEELLVKKAQQGKQVVRLKSGDPYVFGRGGEEGTKLKKQHIPFEVIPGITSAIGGLTYAGIPITHREYASSFHVITGHLKSEEQALDWQTLAKLEGTLVFLMGMAELATITDKLVHFGKKPTTPVAIIEWASRKKQRTSVGTLATIYEIALAAQMEPPSLIVVGGVVALREQLNFFEEKPLFGKTIALPDTQTKNMYHRLIDLGAEVIEFPPVSFNWLSKPDRLPNAADNLVFMDPHSVESFAAYLVKAKKDWRYFSQSHILSIGPQTESTLNKLGLLPDSTYRTLADFWSISKNQDACNLYIGETQGIQEIQQRVKGEKRQRFWVTHEELAAKIPISSITTADYIYLPSSKSAALFLEGLTVEAQQVLKNKKIIVMGELTGNRLTSRQIPVIQPAEPTYESAIETILQEELHEKSDHRC